MAQTPILAPGTGVFSTTPVAIPANTTYSFAIYTTGGSSIPANVGVAVYLDTPGDDQPFAHLTPSLSAIQITGPVDVIFKRPNTPIPIGVVQYAP